MEVPTSKVSTLEIEVTIDSNVRRLRREEIICLCLRHHWALWQVSLLAIKAKFLDAAVLSESAPCVQALF